MFTSEKFVSHSGIPLDFKIECDSLTEDDYAALAYLVAKRLVFSEVHGVPRGGLKFAAALQPYAKIWKRGPILIVDDVLTTGNSMNEFRDKIRAQVPEEIIIDGLVVFARNECPDWIGYIFKLNEDWV